MSGIDPTSAFAVSAGPENWADIFRFVNRLLRSGIRVLVVSEPNESEQLSPGTFVIPLSSELDLWCPSDVDVDAIEAAASDSGIKLLVLGQGQRFVARPANLVRIGLYGGGGAPFNHAGLLAKCGFPVEFFSDAQVRAGRLADVDVFVMPGGGERAMVGQIEPLGEVGCLAIAEFVRGGGMYIGCCAGSYDCIVNDDEFLAACPAQRCLQLINAGPWHGERAVGFLNLQSPGVGVVRVRNERPDHPVMAGMAKEFSIVHYNGPVLDPDIARVVDGGSAAVGLASFAGWTERFTPAERFAGQPPSDEPTYLAQAVAAKRFSIAAGELGFGRVVAFGSHPEFGFDLAMTEWGEPARMFVNAVMWQAVSRRSAGSRRLPTDNSRIGLPAGSSLDHVGWAAEALIGAVCNLESLSIDPAPSWLAPAYAMSVFGLAPDEIWRQSLASIVTLAEEARFIAEDVQRRIARTHDQPHDSLRDGLSLIDRWVLDERPSEWGQDGGYQGVRTLLRTAEEMCQRALSRWETTLGPPAGPYDYFNENPYHLVAGSYLAAIGCVAGAVHLMRGLSAEWSMAEALAQDRRPLAQTAARA